MSENHASIPNAGTSIRFGVHAVPVEHQESRVERGRDVIGFCMIHSYLVAVNFQKRRRCRGQKSGLLAITCWDRAESLALLAVPVLETQDLTRFQLAWINYDMFDALPLPRISHVYHAVFGLNDGGVTEFLLFFLLQDCNFFPLQTVGRNCEIQESPAPPACVSRPKMVVDHQVSSILKRNYLNARIGIGKVGRLHR